MRVNSAMLVVAVAAVAALLLAGCTGKTGNDQFVLPEKTVSNEMPPALPSDDGASAPPSPPSAASSGESSKSTLFK